MISGKRTPTELLEDKAFELNDANVKLALRRMTSNKIASLILFWIELKRRSVDNKHEHELKYNFSLEHVMPQSWNQFWPITSPNVVDAITGECIEDEAKATEGRQAAVYELGNMMLLLSSLNTSLRNYEFERKIKGESRKRGIEYYASNLMIAKDILDIYNMAPHWNEKLIRSRTDALTDVFFHVW